MIAPPKGPELRDIHLPPVPDWWPPAVGWWIVAAMLLVAVIVAIVLWIRRARRRRWVGAVLAELDIAQSRYTQDGDRAALAAATSQLLRRVARMHDEDAVRVRGAEWQALLRSLAPRVDTLPLAVLDDAIYRRDGAIDVDAMLPVARRWLRAAASRKRRPVSSKPAISKRTEAGDVAA
jgi:hypothetical protein